MGELGACPICAGWAGWPGASDGLLLARPAGSTGWLAGWSAGWRTGWLAWLGWPLGRAELVELAGLGWPNWLGWLDCPAVLILLGWAELAELVEVAGLGWPSWLDWLSWLSWLGP